MVKKIKFTFEGCSDSLEEVLLKELKLKKIKPSEIPTIIRNLKSINPIKYGKFKVDFPDKKVKFGLFGDMHIGHSCYRPDILDKMIKDGNRQGVEFYLNAGDTIEGMSGREGHIYELSHIGATEQFKAFKEQFQKFRKPVYSIEAQNSHGGWFKSKGNMGLEIGPELESLSKHYKFIGYDEQDLILANGLKWRLRHSGGATAYAISYKMQKYIESISGGNKPHGLGQGHFHKAQYMFYRNIHGFDVGCLCEQTPFMKKIGTPAHLGYWIIEANMHKIKSKGVERVISQFVPFYE